MRPYFSDSSPTVALPDTIQPHETPNEDLWYRPRSTVPPVMLTEEPSQQPQDVSGDHVVEKEPVGEPSVEASSPPGETTDKNPTGIRIRAAAAVDAMSDEDLLAEAGVEPYYSTSEAAEFFGRTNQWIYWGQRPNKITGIPPFIDENGKPIKPERIGRNHRRFTLVVLKKILLSSYRQGNIDPDELKRVLRRIRINELGGEWRETEGWHFVDVGKGRSRWVHPDHCEQVDGEWVLKRDVKATDDDDEESDPAITA